MKNWIITIVVSFISFTIFGQSLTWQSLNEPGDGGAVTSIRVSPYNANHILLGGDVMGMTYSIDGGLTWNDTYGFNDWVIGDITWHPTDSNIVWAGSMSGPFKSIDGGIHWQMMRTGMDPINNWYYSCPVQKILFDPNDDTHLLAFGGSFRKWYSPGPSKWNSLWESTDGGNTWIEKTTIGATVGYGTMNAIYVDSKIVAAVEDQGIFISTDNGTSWTVSNTGLPNNDALWVAVAQNDTTTLYCSTNNYLSGGTYLPGGVFKSINGGATWTNISTGLEQHSDIDNQIASYYRMVKISPTNSNILFTANGGWSNSMTYKSTDAGVTWNPLFTTELAINTPIFYNFSGPELYVFDFDHNNGDVMIGGNWEYVLKTTDGGINWDDLMSDMTSVSGYFTGTGYSGIAATNFEFNPYNINESVFQGMDDAKFVISKDNLNSWKRGGIGMNRMNGGNDVCFAGINGATLYCTSGQDLRFDGVYKSTDGGDNWTLFDYTLFPGCTPTGGQPFGVYAIPNNPDTAWVTAQDKMYRTTNGGTTWSQVFTAPGIIFIAPAKNSPDTFYVNSQNGVYKTTDGVNFTLMPGSPASGRIIIVDPNNDTILYVTKYKTNDGEEGLWKYDGVTWNLIRSDYNLNNVAVQPSNSQVIMVTTYDEAFHDVMASTGIWFSLDGGSTWTQQSTGLPLLRLTCVTFNPHHPNQVIAGLAGRGFYKTDISSILGIDPPKKDIFDLKLYPNPTYTSVSLSLSLKNPSKIEVKIFSVDGKYIHTLLNQKMTQGQKKFTFERNGLASGVYYFQISINSFISIKKLIVI